MTSSDILQGLKKNMRTLRDFYGEDVVSIFFPDEACWFVIFFDWCRWCVSLHFFTAYEK